MITQILKHVRRLRNARRFRIPFVRRATFKLPTTLRLDDQTIEIVSPDEQGAKNDFLTCFIDDEYGLSELKLPVQTILDIGANIGFFSIAARSYFPAARIHAYEPNPRILTFTLRNANAAQFNLFAEAVGGVSGYVSLDDAGDSNQARTKPSFGPACGIPQVPLATSVQRLGGQVDLAKIDCEGAEWDLFADRNAWVGIDRVHMEYHLWGKHTFAEVETSLREVGFEIYHHSSSGEWGIVWSQKIRR